MVTAIVLINAATDKVSQLARQLTEIEGVTEVFSVAGRWDLVVLVKVGEHAQLATVVSDAIRKAPGITHSETLIAFRAYSRRELETAFSLGTD
ncbi:MAG: Lrp/AsnC family transcriptional regulator [Steroidobacteraceae bacterium]